MNTSNIKLVAFDVFGTIAGGHAHPGPYDRISRELGVDAFKLATTAQTKNLPVAELIAMLAPDQPETLRLSVAERISHDLIEDLANITLFPETVAVFAALKSRDVPTALVSNLATPYAAPIIRLLDSANVLPEICIWSFEVGARKPQRAIYEHLFERAQCSPEEILFIGDKVDRDLRPPRELGCVTRLVAREDSPNYARAIEGVDECDLIGDLTEVFSILKLTPELLPDSSKTVAVNCRQV